MLRSDTQKTHTNAKMLPVWTGLILGLVATTAQAQTPAMQPAATAPTAAPTTTTYTSYYRPAAAATYTPQYAPQPATAYQAPSATTYQNGYYTQPATAAPAQPAYAATTYAASGDPYGFLNWLNGVRAQYGLRAVGYDANLANWAAMNNAQQAARGLGHFVMGPARRQNSAMGHAGSIGAMWMNSPAHRAALLDPSITAIGLAGNGQYWTFNAY